jgi:hypothetical protein
VTAHAPRAHGPEEPQNSVPQTAPASQARKREPQPTTTERPKMITTERIGRNLAITLEGVDEPFIVPPLAGNAGVQITETYIGGTGGIGTAADLAAALMMAVDGGVEDEDAHRWVPRPEAERTTYNRIGNELSQAEAEDVMSVAFFWQTALGDDGVRLFLEGGGGAMGALRALSALKARSSTLNRRELIPAAAAHPTDRKPKSRKKK